LRAYAPMPGSVLREEKDRRIRAYARVCVYAYACVCLSRVCVCLISARVCASKRANLGRKSRQHLASQERSSRSRQRGGQATLRGCCV
jgi:hypothetical protein